jgi:hypothetical protein
MKHLKMSSRFCPENIFLQISGSLFSCSYVLESCSCSCSSPPLSSSSFPFINSSHCVPSFPAHPSFYFSFLFFFYLPLLLLPLLLFILSLILIEGLVTTQRRADVLSYRNGEKEDRIGNRRSENEPHLFSMPDRVRLAFY